MAGCTSVPAIARLSHRVVPLRRSGRGEHRGPTPPHRTPRPYSGSAAQAIPALALGAEHGVRVGDAPFTPRMCKFELVAQLLIAA